MFFRIIAVSVGIVVASLLTALTARAECVIVTAKQVLEDPRNELVFSGTVVAVNRTAELGYRATFDVDGVWKGSVSKRFDLYVWELAAEVPTFARGRHYVAIAKTLDDARARQGAGLGGMDTVAFTPVACTDSLSLSPSLIQDLGPSKPPNQSAGPTQQLAAVTDREAYAIYAVLVPRMWALRSKDPLVLQQETETSSMCGPTLPAPDPDWEAVAKDLKQQNIRPRFLMPMLPIEIPYRIIPRAEIEADDARLAIKYPDIMQPRPRSMEYAAVSVVGFNAAKTKAMVYVRLRLSGTVYAMELREGSWVVAPASSRCKWVV
jgi:hypothetical protein